MTVGERLRACLGVGGRNNYKTFTWPMAVLCDHEVMRRLGSLLKQLNTTMRAKLMTLIGLVNRKGCVPLLRAAG